MNHLSMIQTNYLKKNMNWVKFSFIKWLKWLNLY